MREAEALTMPEFKMMREAFRFEYLEHNTDIEAYVRWGKPQRNIRMRTTRNRALFELLFTLTLRVSDLLSLKVNDVLDKDGNIKEAVLTTEQKNDNHKGVFIREKPKEALKNWLEMADLGKDEYIFYSPYSDGHLSRQQAYNIIHKKAELLGITENKTVATHSGRKTMGRRLYKNDANEQEIREILGHESVKQTRKYMGIFNKDLKTTVMSLPD